MRFYFSSLTRSDTVGIAAEKGIVRFWERAGNRVEWNNKGETVFASYTLSEINCLLKQDRRIRWEVALEDQNTIEGSRARYKFLDTITKSEMPFPTPWETIDPNKHSYARVDFVCKGSVSK